MTAGALVRLMRPHQWIKNGFVFLGLLFGHGWEYPWIIVDVLELFLAFCLVSSAVYVANDIVDLDADRSHPSKRFRPLARGEIGIGRARALCFALGLAGSALAAIVSLPALLIVAGYVVLNLAYSAGLKHVAILDVFLIAGGFMLRILAGTMGVGIQPSKWLLLCGLMLTLFLGFGKRRAALVALAGDDANGTPARRSALDGYSRPLLDILVAVSVSGAAIGYALYTVDAATIARHGTDRLILTQPFVLYGLFRYLQVMYSRGGGGDPAWELLHDPHLLAATAGWLGTTFWFLSG
jgi:4-hydroxybenzoate polyprenyltransferase